MNIFFYHDQKNHSSLIGDLAFCGHNERINKLEKYKSRMKDMMTKDKSFKQANEQAIRYYDKLIKICHKYKNQLAVNDEWLNDYLKQRK